MGRPDAGGGGTPSSYKPFAGPDLHVDITDLTSYYKEMLDIQMKAAGPATMEVSAMTQMIREGLATPAGDAGVFPEGAVVAQLMQQRQSDFQYFMRDVLDGIRNIGSAAVVVAEMYDGTDKQSTAGINDVSFAFADPGAKPPNGFRKVESWSDYQARMAQQSGQMTMAAMGNDSIAQVIHPASGVTLYVYPDGSAKQVSTTSASSSSQNSSTTTTIYGPGAQLIQTTAEEKSTSSDGSQTQSTATTRGDAHNNTTATTSTVTDRSGTITVTNKTSSTSTDAHGNASTTTTTSDPVTIKPGQHHGGNAGAGPVQQAENQLNTHGENWFVQQAGPGY